MRLCGVVATMDGTQNVDLRCQGHFVDRFPRRSQKSRTQNGNDG